MTVLNFSLFPLDAQTTSKKELINCTAEKQKTDSANRKENKLMGEWGIYEHTYTTTLKKKHSTIEETTSTVCNSCPTVTFKDSMTAIIIYPVGKENIKWKVKNDILTLIKNENNTNRAFSDSIYEMTYTQIDKSLELKLVQKNKNYYIILRRQN
jgi:hypothetical protein